MLFWDKLYNFIKGYVVVCVEGFFTEKFTNLCIRNNIKFINVKKLGSSKILLNVPIKEYKNMRKFARKSGCQMTIHKKRGIPFFLFRYRKRKWCIIGIIIFMLLVYIFTLFVWNIEIKGNETIDTMVLKQELKEVGLKEGMLKSKINPLEISYKIMIIRDDIAFISVDMKGTKATVKIVEKVMKPEGINKDVPCDIISKKAGVIVEENVLAGEKNVEVGSVVNEGDLLVGGTIELKEDVKKVHAMAEIKARVWYSESKKLKKSERIDDERLRLFAYKIAYDKIINKIEKDAEIQNEDVKYIEDEEYITAQVTIETIEDIGIEKPIM